MLPTDVVLGLHRLAQCAHVSAHGQFDNVDADEEMLFVLLAKTVVRVEQTHEEFIDEFLHNGQMLVKEQYVQKQLDVTGLLDYSGHNWTQQTHAEIQNIDQPRLMGRYALCLAKLFDHTHEETRQLDKHWLALESGSVHLSQLSVLLLDVVRRKCVVPDYGKDDVGDAAGDCIVIGHNLKECRNVLVAHNDLQE